MYERTYHDRVLKNEENTSPKKKRFFRPRLRLKTILITIGCIALVGICVTLTRLTRLQIASVEIEGTNVADPTEVSTFVFGQLQGTRLYVFPRTSIILAQTRRLERNLRTAFPRFETVRVMRTGLSRLTITVSEYGGAYLWCTDATQCLFMDKNGVVFAEAPYFSGSAYPKVFIGAQADLPFRPITTEQLALIELLTERLNAISIAPTEFHFVSEHNLEIVFLHNSTMSKIMIDPTLSIETSLEALFTALRTQPLSAKYQDASRILQYIDLRFENKVVYKFQ